MATKRSLRTRLPRAEDARRVLGWFNVQAYGAKGDGTTDDTAALQAAHDAAAAAGSGVIWCPQSASYYRFVTANLAFSGAGITLSGPRGVRLVNEGTNNFFSINIPGLDKLIVENLYLDNQATAGHVFSIPGSLSHAHFRHLTISQRNPAKSILSMVDTGGNYIKNHLFDCDLYPRANATVPAWHVKTNSGGLNTSTWRENRWNATGTAPTAGNGQPCIHLESTAASAYTYDNLIDGELFESTIGGCVTILSGRDNIIRRATVYDLQLLGSTTKDLFYIGESPTGSLASVGNTLDAITRRNGVLGAGLVDIRLETSQAGSTTLRNCRTTSTDFAVDCGTNNGLILDGMENAVLTNLPIRMAWLSPTNVTGSTERGGMRLGAGVVWVINNGTPEGNVIGAIGSLCTDIVTGVLYRKKTGTGTTGWVPDALFGSKTWNPGSVADGAIDSTTVTVTGAVVGDVALASHDQLSVAGVLLHAQVTATNTVTVTLVNHSGGAFDLASGTLRVRAMKAV